MTGTPATCTTASPRRPPAPWMVLTLSLLLLGGFGLSTYALPGDDQGGAALAEVLTFWQSRPYLELPARFTERWVDAPLREAAAAARRAAIDAGQLPDAVTVAAEQRGLDARVEELLAVQHQRPLERWSLQPQLGLAQRGLLTHLLLHGGWGHLLLNLTFLVLLGVGLERRWGRLFFAAFFVAGGLVAGLGHLLLAAGSAVPVIGASGAIAACVGAFAVLFGARRLALRSLAITDGPGWTVPAWLVPAAWVLLQVAALAQRGGAEATANIVHVVGLLFGSVVALGYRRRTGEAGRDG